MIVFGYVSDFKWANPLIVTNLSILFCSIALTIMAECVFLSSFILVSAAFGFFISAIISLQSIVIVYVFGLENLADAWGLFKMFIGVATIIGPPFTGFLFDQTNAYNISFYVAGGIFASSSIFSWLAFYKQNAKQREETNTVEENRTNIEIGNQNLGYI